MTKPLLLTLLGLFSLTGCDQGADEIRPANYDVLAMETGHWEWELSTRGFSGNFTPATTGYTRQLVFGAEGQLTVYRGSQSAYRTTYELSMGQDNYCKLAGISVPLITYKSELGLPNDDIKIYRVTQNASGVQSLSISGESSCVDGGAYETYHWVKE